MTPGTVAWLESRLQAHGGRMPEADLRAELERIAGAPPFDEVADRIAHSPLFVQLADREIALTRPFLQGAFFRYTPATEEIAEGLLTLEGTELSLVYAQSVGGGPDPEVIWRGLADDASQRRRLARTAQGWVLPGLGGWLEQTSFEPGDDVVVHVREVTGPLLVFDRVSRFDRDEGALARRNHALLEAAVAVLREGAGGWIAIERLIKQLLARYDYRHAYPPDSFGRRLLNTDTRFTLGRDGHEVRLSYFYHDDTARAYLRTLASPEEALASFFEEFPPHAPQDREKAVAYLNELWQDVPRPELAGLTPRQAAQQSAKVVQFPHGHEPRPRH